MDSFAPQRRPYKIRGSETWALIREAYLAGAPAKVLAARYDVTPHAIYARASRQKWPKHLRIEPAPQSPLPVWAAPKNQPEPSEAADWAPAPGTEEPGDLARAALRGVGAAMRGGRTDEAKTLAQLADVLSRVSLRGPSSTLETVVRALHDPAFRVDLLAVWDDPDPDPIKKRYWEEEARRSQVRSAKESERRREEEAAKAEMERLRAVVARVAPDELAATEACASDGPLRTCP